MKQYIAKWNSSLCQISEKEWNDLLEDSNIPFYKWNWLNKLENSESITKNTGWLPCHLSIIKDTKTIAVAPLYLKAHSYGEFIFDHIFVKLAESIGLSYYPKLVGMSPVSPVEGYKFFISSNENKDELTELMLKEIDNFAISNGILSCNFLYVDKEWGNLLEEKGFKKWVNEQSLWKSSGEKSFSDYLQKFNANQRRNIKRERRFLENSGIEILPIQGNLITEDMMELMYNFYQIHCSKWGPWGSKYLSQSFFKGLKSATQENEIILFNANRGNYKDPIAMSLCITNMERIWGRYWGSKEEINYLHFELCYYSPLEWAIEKGIKEFDPGAGGRHKKRRGFLATPRISLHKWYDTKMASILEVWLPKINNQMNTEINASNNEAPIKSK